LFQKHIGRAHNVIRRCDALEFESRHQRLLRTGCKERRGHHCAAEKLDKTVSRRLSEPRFGVSHVQNPMNPTASIFGNSVREIEVTAELR
jgi:hypothetical protein